MPLCRHCQREPQTQARGLCWRCYTTPRIRSQYPVSKPGSKPGGPRCTEPTEEELDALIAEQMKNLPPWWEDAAYRAQQKGQPVEILIVHDPRRNR